MFVNVPKQVVGSCREMLDLLKYRKKSNDRRLPELVTAAAELLKRSEQLHDSGVEDCSCEELAVACIALANRLCAHIQEETTAGTLVGEDKEIAWNLIDRIDPYTYMLELRHSEEQT